MIRSFALMFALGVLAAAAAVGCGSKCRISSQCEAGEHCDFGTGDCVPGCKTDDDCLGNTKCDPKIGVCRFHNVPPPVPTTTTSTTPDAG